MGPGPYGLGPYGLIGAKGQIWLKKCKKIYVLRMGFSIVENLSGSSGSNLSVFRGSQLNLCATSNKIKLFY